MSRKLDKKRLYIVVRFLVVLVSVLSIGVASLYLLNYDKIAHNAYLNTLECQSRFSGVNSPGVCGWYYKDLAQVSSIIWYGFGIGFSLLVLFFGGTKLYDFLFPEKSK